VRPDDDFTAYVAARWATLVRTAVLLGCRPHDAEDVVQTALVRCLRHWSRVRASANPDGYVYRVLVNALTDSTRRPWRRETPAVAPDDVGGISADIADEVAVRVAVLSALYVLPDEQRQVVVLRFVADLTEQQTADVLGLPLGTVKSRASRALARLGDSPQLDGLTSRRNRR
jgi:RNA polymerase sigma-70 factor (sigma-E family)